MSVNHDDNKLKGTMNSIFQWNADYCDENNGEQLLWSREVGHMPPCESLMFGD